MTATVLITGSAGLIGSEVASHFSLQGYALHGIDNNQRALFFGPHGDTTWRRKQLLELNGYQHHDLDIRNREGVLALVRAVRPTIIVHAAAQPSHDLAAQIPLDDFDINAVGTLNLLEAARQFCPEAPFVYLSTNKVYGDRPNLIPLVEKETRWDFADPAFADGIAEDFPVDQSLHSLFGASKLAADVLVQEYGRYFGMPTCALRCGCLTGPAHSSVEQHGFLSYLARCNLEGWEYTIFGYQGKQVRDILHAADVAQLIEAFSAAPRCGEVYNLGGGKKNSCSIREAIRMIEAESGKRQKYCYTEQHRIGDHVCYFSHLGKVTSHYPGWCISRSLRQIVADLVDAWSRRLP